MISKTINDINELLNFINELHYSHGTQLWYRGHDDATYPLIPSIQRSNQRIHNERFLSNDFYIKTKQILPNSPDKHNYAAWMSLMQHYGLPTRLLDWSQSPLIATFFATETYKETSQVDACIWVLLPSKLNKQEGFVECLFPVDAETVQGMLLPAFKDRMHDPELCNKIIACHFIGNDLRMYCQQSNFTVHNSLRKLEDICDSNTLYKIIIPKERKQYFWYCLNVFGITEGFVYPDPEHISKELKRLYNI